MTKTGLCIASRGKKKSAEIVLNAVADDYDLLPTSLSGLRHCQCVIYVSENTDDVFHSVCGCRLPISAGFLFRNWLQLLSVFYT